MTLGIFITIVVVIIVVLAAQWLVFLSRRLDRLHKRYAASWLSLESALNQRAQAALIAAEEIKDMQLIELAKNCQTCEKSERYRIENDVSHRLAELDPYQLPRFIIAQLADAHARVTIARRFYDDAVFDTRNLRKGRVVRWFHLAGTAQLPEYFNIIELPMTIFPLHETAQDNDHTVVQTHRLPYDE